MAVEQAGTRIGDRGKSLLDIGDEFLDQRRASRAVGRAIGEDMMAGAAIRIEQDPDEVLAGGHPRALSANRDAMKWSPPKPGMM